MTINLIAAISKTNQLGYKNKLLTELPNDLARFKELTLNSICVQGRKTYESIIKRNEKPLSHRTNIVVSRNVNYHVHPSCYLYNSVDDIIREYEEYSEKETNVFVIGGKTLYQQFLPYADYIYLTIINHIFPKADTYFPQFTLDDWKIIEHIKNKADEQHLYDYHYVTYKRKK